MSETVYLTYLLTCSCFNNEKQYQLPKAFRDFIWIKTTIIFLTISVYPSISGAIIVYAIFIFLYSCYISGIDQIRLVKQQIGFFFFFFFVQCVIYCIIMCVTLVKDVKNIGLMKYMVSEHGSKTMVGVVCPTMLLFMACLFMLIESSLLYRNVERSRELVEYYNITRRRSRTTRKEADYKTNKKHPQKEHYEISAELYYLQLDRNNIQLTSKTSLMEAPYPWSKGAIITTTLKE